MVLVQLSLGEENFVVVVAGKGGHGFLHGVEHLLFLHPASEVELIAGTG